MIAALVDYGISVSIYDPWANPAEVKHEYGLEITTKLPNLKFDSVVLGVAHKEFNSMDFDSIRKQNSVLYDVKGILKENVDGKL